MESNDVHPRFHDSGKNDPADIDFGPVERVDLVNTERPPAGATGAKKDTHKPEGAQGPSSLEYFVAVLV